eukprot:NODE_968_length_2839_cov_0.556569.p2 type:complete len:210 gc:universal NODE_968_length_2839_cov_0.556569:826-197(-)
MSYFNVTQRRSLFDMLSLAGNVVYEADLPFKFLYFCGKVHSMKCITINTDKVILDEVEYQANVVIYDYNFVGIHVNPSQNTKDYLKAFEESSYNEKITIDQISYDLSNFIFLQKLRPCTNTLAERYFKLHYKSEKICCEDFFRTVQQYCEIYPYGHITSPLVSSSDSNSDQGDIGDELIKLGRQMKTKNIKDKIKLHTMINQVIDFIEE